MIEKGVKGFRLDAVTHFYNENTSQNIEFLSWFTSELKKIKPDVYLVGEAWTGQTIIKDLYKSQIPSFFNFGFSNATGTIVSSIKTQDGQGLSVKIQDWQKLIKQENPDAIDAVFLSNHDNARSAGALSRNLSLEKMGAAV